MGVEAIARKATLNHSQSSMVAYRRLMPLQFEAGCMLRSFSDGTPSYPRMLYSNAQQKFRVIPRALSQSFLRDAVRRCKSYEIRGKEVKDWQAGLPFMASQHCVVEEQDLFKLMDKDDVDDWLEVVRETQGTKAVAADRRCLETWRSTNKAEFVRLEHNGRSSCGRDLLTALSAICGNPMFCSPVADEPSLMLTKGRLLLLCILGAINALSEKATDDTLPRSHEEHTNLSNDDQSVRNLPACNVRRGSSEHLRGRIQERVCAGAGHV